MNSKMTTNSQLSTNEPKRNDKTMKTKTKQTTKTETESQICRSCGGLSVGRGKGETEAKGAGIKKYEQVGTKWTGGC